MKENISKDIVKNTDITVEAALDSVESNTPSSAERKSKIFNTMKTTTPTKFGASSRDFSAAHILAVLRLGQINVVSL